MTTRDAHDLTPRRRVLTALRGEQPDRVPIVDCIDWSPMVALAQLAGVDVPAAAEPFAFERLAARLTRVLGIDSIWVPMPLGEEPVDEERVRDRYGSVYRLSVHGEPTVEEGPIGSLHDLAGFDMAGRLTAADFEGVRTSRDLLGPDYPVWVYFADTFKLSWKLRGGMEALLWDFVKDPELVHGLARVTTDATIATVRGAAEAGADVLLMEGDLAANKAPIFSPAHFREYVKPYYAEIVAAAHDCGLPIVKHSDGNMWPLMEDLIEVGFDGYNPVQPQCMDIAEVKEKLGDRICLVGNIDCVEVLVSAGPDEVTAVVRETLRTAAPGGGYILASSNSIHAGVAAENYLAMVRAGLEYGAYPV
jgi:uroporphyrinogen decarboxylase